MTDRESFTASTTSNFFFKQNSNKINNSIANKENTTQKPLLKDASFFDQLKNANFSDLSTIVRNYKTNNVL